MTNYLFADGIANVSVGSGVVRIDFFVSRPTGPAPAPGDSGEARREQHMTVSMPLPSFVNSMNVLQALMNQLMNDGLVTANPGGGEPRARVQ